MAGARALTRRRSRATGTDERHRVLSLHSDRFQESGKRIHVFLLPFILGVVISTMTLATSLVTSPSGVEKQVFPDSTLL
jgi:hypothetical protein